MARGGLSSTRSAEPDLSLSLLHKPHDHLTYLSYNILALMKLCCFAEASTKLDSLEDLDGSTYHYESYPDVYPNRVGSMVPFSLWWLHALVLIKLGNRQDGLDRLYCLLDFIQTKLKEKEKKEKENDGLDMSVSVSVWKKREVFVVNSIMGFHLKNKEFSVCLSLIKKLLNCNS